MTNNERKITTNFHGRTQEEWQIMKEKLPQTFTDRHKIIIKNERKTYHRLSLTDTKMQRQENLISTILIFQKPYPP